MICSCHPDRRCGSCFCDAHGVESCVICKRNSNPAETDRAATRALANRILQSVHDDERMPLPFESFPVHATGECVLRSEVEMFALELCQLIQLLTADLAIANARLLRDSP